MIRVLVWLIRRLGPGALLWLALLLVALASVALGLADAVRGVDATLLLPIAALGLLVGWGLAKSPLPGWLAGPVAAGLGTEYIVVRIGRLGGHLSALLQTLAAGIAELVVALFRGVWQPGQPAWVLTRLPDWKPFLAALAELWAGITTLSVRMQDWSLAIATGKPTFDPVAVALTWSLALWIVAVWAGWWVRRHDRPLPGIAPAGILLGASTFYVGGNSAFLLPVLGITWLLIVLAGQSVRERRWRMTEVDYPVDVGQEVILAGTALSLVLVMTAMLVPFITVRQFVEWAGRLFNDQVSQGAPDANWIGLNRRAAGSGTFLDQDQVRAPGLPRRHLLGSGPELSQRVVMVIHPQAAAPTQGKLSQESAVQYYWRGLTYDWYNGRGWITRGTETQEYRAGDLAVFRDRFEPPVIANPAITTSSPNRRQVRMEVRAVGAMGELLYVAGDLLTADQDYRVAWRSSQDVFGATLLATGRSRGEASQAGETGQATGAANPLSYRIDSLVPVVGEAQLRAAGTDYPAWVQMRYLSLPDKVPARVLALARDLTATAPTPYDRARAIESYLRTFPYSLDVPLPPQERDVVDYFLFDLKQGYCDYYATAMVVLARAAGLPARLAVGYFSGTYDEANTRYIVTEADAHSWVEVYFPTYGWIEFEPTAGRSPINRPADVPPSVPPELEALEPSSALPVAASQPWWLVLLAAVILPVLGGLAWSLLDGWRLRRLPPQAAATVLYWRLYRHGRRLAGQARPGDTPYEFVTSFAQYVLSLAQARRWGTLLTPAVQEARWLADLYVRTCYAPHPPGVADRDRAIRTWRRLRRRLWLARAYQAVRFGLHFIAVFSRPARRAGHLPTG